MECRTKNGEVNHQTRICVPIDTSHLPYFFTRLPVRTHKDKEEIHRFALELIDATKEEDFKAHKHALYRYAFGPDMNIYSLSRCEADLDKIKLLIDFIELTWAHGEPLENAVAESERLCRAMYEEYDDEPVADNGFGLRIRRFRDIRNRMKAIDSVGWVEVRDATEEWFHIDTKLKDFESLEEYLNIRKVHVGNKIMTSLMRWTMGVHLSEGELAFVEPYTDSIGVWLGLMNDYMSWKRERTQPTDRAMKSVHVVVNRYNFPEEASVDMVRDILVKQEGKVVDMSEELHGRTMLSTGMRMYIRNLEYYAGGMFYWHFLAPRYTKPQSFDPERAD
ncbi:hypothetical protein EST38_g5905 [Candolleomyces aberdarensis]|uniref:Terpene synthase n=1 Tax=Candolleomyces aberdarensis TaxID=2316362 RepID=A0A4Q2DM02_9AGAR|nr:hypothetical protein EST38_g5905 [Candolleomyces aberdarensis]